MNDILDNIEDIIKVDISACDWLLGFLATDGLQYMRPFILECTFREVRVAFSNLIERCFFHYYSHHGRTDTEDLYKILDSMVSLVEKDAANTCKNTSQLFWVLSKFSQMVSFVKIYKSFSNLILS